MDVTGQHHRRAGWQDGAGDVADLYPLHLPNDGSSSTCQGRAVSHITRFGGESEHSRSMTAPPAPSVELLACDLDGTLVETAPEICDALNDVMGQFAWPTVSENRVAAWIGRGTGELLLQAVADATREQPEVLRNSERMADVERLYAGYYDRRCGTRSRLYPEVRETLAAARQWGVKTAVVTNKERCYTERVLAAHGLCACFDRVLCGDTMAARKPAPDGILDCLRAFAVPAERALFVGDSSIDAATARNAGVPVWLVPYGYNLGRPIHEARPDRVIADFGELRRLLAATALERF